jgi:hypothetical protein
MIRRKPVCKRGHDLTDPNNVRERESGYFECVPCNRERNRGRYWGDRVDRIRAKGGFKEFDQQKVNYVREKFERAKREFGRLAG